MRKLQDELGFALKKIGDEWYVIEDDADYIYATIRERVLWDALIAALAAPVAPALVPLTDEQLISALASVTNEPPVRLPPGWRKFAKAIEAAHGIKP